MAKKETKTAEQAIELDVQLTKAEAFIEKNLKKILIILAGIIVVAVAIFASDKYFSAKENEAQQAIAKAQEAFASQQYEQALNGDGQTAGFLKIITDYSMTKTANLAKLYAAICYANTDKVDEAIKMFEGFSQEDDQMISPASFAALGNCYIEKGDNQKGAELLVKAAKKADNDALSPVFLLQAGKVYEEMGQKDKALEVYEQIKKNYVMSPAQNDIDKYIERVK